MWQALDDRSDVIRFFHPAWFAAVMGTGILAVATHHADAVVPGLENLAVALWVLSTALAAVLLVPWVLRWVRYPREAWADTAHPTRGPFYSTFPIGLLVLGVDFAAIGSARMDADAAIRTAQVLWVAGAVLAFVLGVVIPIRWFTHDAIELRQVNGGWFIPPVANIVVPAAAAPLISSWGSPEACRAVCVVAFAFLGIGFFLFLVVGVLLIARLVDHGLPEAHLIPTLWIGLGPIGVGSLALVRLSMTASPIFGGYDEQVQVLLRLASLGVWGFGLWWLAVAVVVTVRALREPFPFAMSWWAFTFPLGAYTVATFLLGDAFEAGYLTGFGFALWILLLAFWLLVLVRTLAAAYTGAIFAPPPGAPAVGEVR
jgi:C4-dicarboxylate transporter/malic acid transport protein